MAIKDPRKESSEVPWYMNTRKMALGLGGGLFAIVVIITAFCAAFNVGPGFMPWNDNDQPVVVVPPEKGDVNGTFSRPATDEEMERALAEIKALKAQINASAPESAEAVRTTATGVAIVNPPTIEAVDGRTVSDWRDSARIGLAEKITLGRDELTMQESGNVRRGALTWDNLRTSGSEFQAAFMTAKEDEFGNFLINKVSIWAPTAVRYENNDGNRVAVLVKVGELEYRLWEITPNTRSVPTSKDDLKPVQYAWTPVPAPAPTTTRDVVETREVPTTERVDRWDADTTSTSTSTGGDRVSRW